MEQRIAPLNGLKDRGVAGRTIRDSSSRAATRRRPISESSARENADRRTVYAASASQTGAKPDAVGRHRAQQMPRSRDRATGFRIKRWVAEK
jgi:hypothetical protein